MSCEPVKQSNERQNFDLVVPQSRLQPTKLQKTGWQTTSSPMRFRASVKKATI
jgi:hypothetical protein